MIEQTTENALFDKNNLLKGYRVKFNRNAILLQTDANQRADWYKKMVDLTVYDTDRIKQLEDFIEKHKGLLENGTNKQELL